MSRINMNACVSRGLVGMFGEANPDFDGRRIDANETATYARQLEHVFAKTYELVYPDAAWRKVLAVNSEVPNWADSHTYRQEEGFGEAGFVHTYFAKDFPSVEVQGAEHSGVIKSIGSSYSYTIQDLRKASATGKDLSASKAKKARDFIERMLDRLAFVGDTKTGFTGLAAAGTSVSAINGDWQNNARTPAQILADIQKMAESVFESTLGTFRGKVLCLGPKAYKKVHYTFISDATAPRTTLETFLLSEVPDLERIVYCPRLATAGGSSKERIILMDNSPEVVEAVLPQDFEQFAPQQDGMAFRVQCHARWGGLKLHQAKAIAYMDGTEA